MSARLMSRLGDLFRWGAEPDMGLMTWQLYIELHASGRVSPTNLVTLTGPRGQLVYRLAGPLAGQTVIMERVA